MPLRLPAIMRTTAARLSALYFILFALCAVAAGLLHDVAVGAHADGADAGDDQRGGAGPRPCLSPAAGCPAGAHDRAAAPASPAPISISSPIPTAGSWPAMSRACSRACSKPRAGPRRPFPTSATARATERRSRGDSRPEQAAGGQRDAARGDRAGVAPAQPDDRAGRPRPRRAGALPRRRPPGADGGARHDGARRAADLVSSSAAAR